ncbi:DUF4129 domain-containing protein [Microbacterium sp. P04]|uniref:DUF4129 domain-containing protein n=1 Tax=Microbacterium sp. P04 TaxID=3366947 RepID=UPI00374663D3
MSRAVAELLLAGAALTPDRDDAREWAERELQDPAYAAAEPNLIDRAAQAVGRFFESLFGGGIPSAWGPAFAVIASIVVVVIVVAALLIWGRPRSVARVRADERAELFGETDVRSAVELRRLAAAAAARSDWDDAIVLRFRAVARGVVERTAVEVPAGTTVHGFARTAAAIFPAEAGRMDAAAAAFDDVRYLRRRGTREMYDNIAALDDSLARARPVLASAR